MTELWRAWMERCDLLGLELLPLAALGLDLLLLLYVAGRAVAALDPERAWSAARRLLAAGLVGLATVVLSVTLVGALDRLAATSLVLVHGSLAGLLALTDRRGTLRASGEAMLAALAVPLAAALAPWRAVAGRRGWRSGQRGESAVLVAILAILVFYLVLATFTLPLNFDANTYRLSRIALWLQNADVYHLVTNDARQNFTGQNADFAMLWLMSFFSRGYPLVALAQWAGGVLACVAVWELCAQLGLGRRWRFAGVAVLLGTPTASLQFFTAQTDLFAAGTLAAGLAFLLPALRERRASSWALLGIGGGLALGTKATVLFWAPALALLFIGWTLLERCPLFVAGRGVALAALVAVPLCGFNAVQNQLEFSRPVAPPQVVERSLKPEAVSQRSWLTSNVLALSVQLADPFSNPWVPRPWSEAWSDSLIERTRVTRPDDGKFAQRWTLTSGWLRHGLSEDYASFGLLVSLLGVAGGALALLRLGDRTERRRAAQVALLAVAVAVWVIVACGFQPMTTLHQFRYFCYVAPATAVVAAYALSAARGLAGAAAVTLVLGVQLATGIYAGVESRHHGWRSLLQPSSAPNYPLWAEAQGVIEALGEEPLRVGLALQRNTWLAPLLRTGVDYRYTLVSIGEIFDFGCLNAVLSGKALDVMVLDARVLALARAADSRLREGPAPRIAGLLVVWPPDPSSPPTPPIVRASGVFVDGWTETTAVFEHRGCRSGEVVLRVANPAPFSRRLTARSGRDELAAELAPGAHAELKVGAGERDVVRLEVSPPFVPSEWADSSDERRLGLLLSPATVEAVEGVDGDGWTRREARMRVSGSYAAELALDVSNPTHLPRRILARSGAGVTSFDLPPGKSHRLTLAVHFEDTATLLVEPPFVPAREMPQASEDQRPLGVRLSAADLEWLGVPP